MTTATDTDKPNPLHPFAMPGGLSPPIVPVPIAYQPTQAAAVSGRNRTRIFEAIKNGELEARKDGKATIIEHGELMRWVRTFPVIKARA